MPGASRTKVLGLAQVEDDNDPLTHEALALLARWPKEESMRIYHRAKATKSTDLVLYFQALTCDPENELAAHEARQILSSRKWQKARHPLR